MAPDSRVGGGVIARVLEASLALALATLLTTPLHSAQALTISPLPGTPDASPATQISFLGERSGQIAHVTVTGSRSGRHSGRLERYASGPGASFLPSRPFTQGESVTVTARVGRIGRRRRVSSSFRVARVSGWGPAVGGRPTSTPSPPGSAQSFQSEPALSPPSVSVAVDSPRASRGDVFLTPARGPGEHGPMIVDGAGNLVWFQPAPAGTVAEDLQVEQYEGQPVLVWWEGRILDLGVGLGVDEVYSSSYQPVARIVAGNGYVADLHDLQITPQGSAFITAFAPVRADLSAGGGPRHGALLDAVVQELDIKTGLVMFEWHAFAHVPLNDSFTTPSRRGEPWDYFHINSISLDPWGDGNFIISARNTWAAYEVSRHTGRILWRIGGRHPTFRMGSGTGIAFQHDVRWQPDHTLTIFDDGAYPKVHAQSRVIRERIDWSRRTVTLVGRAVHSPAVLAGSQGNEQVLPDGNSFVGWGEAPYMTEFGPSGEVLFDARLPPTVQSYRAYRFRWRATPTAPPALAVASTGPGAATAYVSWNGATGVSAWRILGGTSPTALGALATAPRAGFETAIALRGADTWFAAQALGSDGRTLATSRVLQR